MTVRKVSLNISKFALYRWQAFMLGRPLAFSSHHFDTQLPSYCDPAIDKTGRLYAPNVALFRLAYILGDIMDDAVSVRPVSYESVQANDRALTEWMDSLPVELDLDEYRMARSLASPNTSVRRVGVQSVVIRASYHHIRFSLHRPYASSSTSGLPGGKQIDPAKAAQSLEIAVGAADKLITIVTQSRPDFLANSALAVPGHMSWGPFHAFSAAMFFSFHLIAHPEQPGAGLFRQCIRKATSLLEQARGNSVADKGYDILQALSPLYSNDFPIMNSEAREKQRQHVLSIVRKLAFPLHDSRDLRRSGETPSDRVSSNSDSVSPTMGAMTAIPPQQFESLHNMSTVRIYSHVQTKLTNNALVLRVWLPHRLPTTLSHHMPNPTHRMVTTIPIMHSIFTLLMKHPCGGRRLDSAKESGVNSWTVYSLHQRQDLDTFKYRSDILLIVSPPFYVCCLAAIISWILHLVWMYVTSFLIISSFTYASFT